MTGKDRAPGAGRVTILPVFDLNMASAYYACVFDAEIGEDDGDGLRSMTVGSQQFSLKVDKTGAPAHDPHVVAVEDADVCVARGAAKGGRITDPVSDGADHRRTGAIRDPFGLSWRINNRA